MNVKKLVNAVGTGVVMSAVSGFAVAGMSYGEAGSEWLNESPGNTTIVAIVDGTYGEASAEWLSDSSVTTSVSIAGVDDINQINEAAPAASGIAASSLDYEKFFQAE